MARMHDANLLEDQPIAWTPTPEVIERAQLTKFMRQVGVSTWDELYEFSIRDVERFTEEVLKFLDIRFDPPYTKLLDTSSGVEFPKWLQRSAVTPVRESVTSGRRAAPPGPDRFARVGIFLLGDPSGWTFRFGEPGGWTFRFGAPSGWTFRPEAPGRTAGFRTGLSPQRIASHAAWASSRVS